MSKSELYALAIADCTQFSPLIREDLANQHEGTGGRLYRDLSDLVGLVEWSLPLDCVQQSELNKARVYLAQRHLNQALTCVEGVLKSA